MKSSLLSETKHPQRNKISYLLTETVRLLREVGEPQPPAAAPVPAPQPSPVPPQAPSSSAPAPVGPGKVDEFIKVLNDVRAAPSFNDGATYQSVTAWFNAVAPEEQETLIRLIQGLNDAVTGSPPGATTPGTDPQQPVPPSAGNAQVPPPAPAAQPASQAQPGGVI